MTEEIELAREVAALRRTVDGLVMRVTICEAIFGFIAAGAIRAVPEGVQRGLIADLREISATTTSGGNPARSLELVLEMEERAQQLIDRIEGIVRSRVK